MISNLNPYRKKKVKPIKATAIRRSLEQMEHDRVFITKFYVRGYSYREIAKLLNEELTKSEAGYVLTESAVYNDINIIQIEWKRERMETIEEYIQKELRKLEEIETQLWQAWEMSKMGKRKVKIRGGELDGTAEGKGGKLQNRVAETSAGDPKFLDLLLNVQDKRAKLLGYDIPLRAIFDKPMEVAITDVDWTLIPDDAITKMADAIQDQKADFAKRKTLPTEGYSDYKVETPDPKETEEEPEEVEEIESDGLTF